jgi:F-type H+-transporting ATPase subunit c
MKKLVQISLALSVLLMITAVVLGQPAEAPAQPAAPAPAGDEVTLPKALAIVGACLGAGLSAVGGGFGIARIGGATIESIARQPEAAGSVFAPMIITAAMVEGGMLFAIVICLLGVLGI